MNFCKPNEYLDFMRQCPELERMFVNSGVKLYKYCVLQKHGGSS
jgi:polyphosphate kinase